MPSPRLYEKQVETEVGLLCAILFNIVAREPCHPVGKGSTGAYFLFFQEAQLYIWIPSLIRCNAVTAKQNLFTKECHSFDLLIQHYASVSFPSCQWLNARLAKSNLHQAVLL